MTLLPIAPGGRAAAALLSVVVVLAPGSGLGAQESPLLAAMRGELSRAMAGLRIPGQPAPYFIAYSIDDIAGRQLIATLGASVSDNRQHTRMLRVDVRVGDYARDSSRFLSFDQDPGVASMYGRGVVQAPLDEDVAVLRRQLWLVTDAAYRKALGTFAKKQAAVQNQAITPDPVPDWSRETPRTTLLPGLPSAVSADAWVDHARALSAALAGPELTRSEATLMVMQGTRYAVNSEGFTTVAPIQQTVLRLVVEAQAEDGMPLRDSLTIRSRTIAGLPAPTDLAARARELAASLVELRKAPVGEAFTGPVLVEGQASAELLAQTLVPLFQTLRAPEAENAQMIAGMMRASPAPFLTRVGSRVLPESFTVSDTPSLASFASQEVAGAYAVDDEGVPAQDVTLCDKGVLKTLLTSRTPQRGFLTSNGHGRGGLASAGVFQVQSATAVPAAALKEKYLARLKADGREHGYIVRTLVPSGVNPSGEGDDAMSAMMRGPEGPSGPGIVRAFRVTPDGGETLVRGLQFGAVPHAAFKDIAEASIERGLYSYRPSVPPAQRMMLMLQGGQGMEGPVVSLIAPNLIFGELEIEKPDRPFQRPPVVPSPLR
jgi:hypothetical protein